MFQSLAPAPPDAILGLAEAFRADPNPAKINLTVGVYKDAAGNTPVLECVKEAERRLLESESSKGYLGIDGLPGFGDLVRELMFGAGHEIVAARRSATLQTPGGTAALRVAADLIAATRPAAEVHLSRPTWANHPSIFAAAGLGVQEYAYADTAGRGLDFPAMLKALEKIPTGDVVLLHACCHNPSGIDPSADQWHQISEVVERRDLLPLVDFAYQGLGDGLEEDAAGLRALCRPGRELLVCSSFSKNFGLYSERVGALTIVAESSADAQAALSHAKRCVRVNYSNPPKHGGAVVEMVLADSALRRGWEQEVARMRNRIAGMRKLFVETMRAKAPSHDFSFLNEQRGMFSFSGLTPMQVDELKSRHALYIVGSGRINVAGMTEANMGPLCDAIAAVL